MTDVPNRHLGFLAHFLGELDVFLASLFGERRDAQPNELPIVGRLKPEIGDLDGLFDLLNPGRFPRLDGDEAALRHREAGDLFEWRGRTVTIHLNPVEEG
jgi:hypothetical protein